MDVQAVFGIAMIMSFLSFGMIAWLYIWPLLARWSRDDALTLLMAPHTTRFIGLTFLIPGVVSPSLPQAFAAPAAWGDLIAAVLAMLAIVMLRARANGALALVWLFNLWGTADLLNALYVGRFGLGIDPGALGAGYFIPTVAVPPLLILHVAIFWLLLRPVRVAMAGRAR